MPFSSLTERLICPVDRQPVRADEQALLCAGGHRYAMTPGGFFDLTPSHARVATVDSTYDDYMHRPESGGDRLYGDYLASWLDGFGATRVLDLGCGIGSVVEAMAADGRDAIGIDVASVAPFWAKSGRDPERYVAGDGTSLPFADGTFDAVITLGVIEHVGTATGHFTLSPTYQAERAAFCAEARRVTRRGGRVLLACPNKWFPLDLQHGPVDELSGPMKWRRAIFDRFGVTMHPTWGEYFLPSYRDVRRWFPPRSVVALPLEGYFGFSALERPGVPSLFGRAARRWVTSLPRWARATALNPYLLVEVRVD